jgi:hypothetical protein
MATLPQIELITADANDLVLGALLQPPWGIYLNGAPVIQPATVLGQAVNAVLAPVAAVAALVGVPGILPVTASTVEFDFAQDWPLSNYPQEQGAFQTYDKVTLPFDVKLRLACGGSTSVRQAFLSTCLAIGNSFALFDVVTPEMTFTSVNCTHLGWPRRATDGNTLIKVDLYFLEIPVTATASFSNTQQPGGAAPQSLGPVQPVTPSQNVQQSFDAVGAN